MYSRDWESHLQHLKITFDLFRQHTLFAKASKCSFAQNQIDYLGHVISAKGVAVDPSKVKVVSNWPLPSNVKAVRGFLGLTGYYRKFIKDYGTIARHLTALLKKDCKFILNSEADSAFTLLKQLICSTPMLALPDFQERFVIEIDASNSGVGAVLMQRGHPIAFASKVFGPRSGATSTYERELRAIIFAVQQW